MLELYVAAVDRENETYKNGILKALETLSEADNDFKGENGDDYLWDWVRDAGFKTNAEYAFYMASKEEKAEDIIDVYFKNWCEIDCYYSNYTYSCCRDEDGYIISIALAFDSY